MIRLVEEKDLQQIMELGKDYMRESVFYDGIDFDEGNAWDSIYYRFLSEDNITCVAVDGDTVMGFVSLNIDTSYTKQKIAFEEIYYIAPKYRRGKVAIKLCDFFVEQCRINDVVKIFTTSTAGFDNEGHHSNVFTRLLKKFGFVEIKGGCVLIKDLTNVEI